MEDVFHQTFSHFKSNSTNPRTLLRFFFYPSNIKGNEEYSWNENPTKIIQTFIVKSRSWSAIDNQKPSGVNYFQSVTNTNLSRQRGFPEKLVIRILNFKGLESVGGANLAKPIGSPAAERLITLWARLSSVISSERNAGFRPFRPRCRNHWQRPCCKISFILCVQWPFSSLCMYS